MSKPSNFNFLDPSTFAKMSASSDDMEHFSTFIEQSLSTTLDALKSFKDSVKPEKIPIVYPPLIPVKLSVLVSAPVLVSKPLSSTKKKAPVDTTTPDIAVPKQGFMHKDTRSKKQRPIIKQRVATSVQKKEPLPSDIPLKIKEKTKTKPLAPIEEKNKTLAQNPTLTRVSAAQQEQKLKERQAKLSTLYDDKGTLS